MAGLLLMVVGLSSSLMAQSVADTTDVDSLRNIAIPDVVIVSHREHWNVIPARSLKGVELERMNALNVADALRYMSGVQLKDYGGVGGIKTINIRSMGSQHVGVYYNGIQLGNAQNGQVDLGKFSLDNIEQIDLYNGQRSDIWQSAREFGSAGSIYLTTRRPRFKEGERVHVRAQMRAGSFALANPSLNVDVKLLENMSLTMSGEYVYSNGRYPFRYKRVTPSGEVAYDTTAVRENGDIQAVRAEAHLNHYYSSTGFWKMGAYFYRSERGVPGAIVNNVWRNGERLWDRDAFAQLTWQDQLWDRWSIRANLKYSNDYTHYINLDERLLYVDNEYLQQEVYATVANRVTLFPWWAVALAYDIQYNHLSMYMNAHRLTHWLSMATEFSISDIGLQIQASLLATCVQEDKGREDSAEDRFKLTPGLFLNYSPLLSFGVMDLYAYYKQSYRYPTFNDLYYTDMGSANLRPELARQRCIGIRYSIPQVQTNGVEWMIQTDYYYNRVTDKIVAYPKGQQFRWTMLNLGEVKIHGVDISTRLTAALPMAFTLSGQLQYTYQSARDVTNVHDTYYGHQIPYIPWHSGSCTLGLDWHGKPWLQLGMNYSFVYAGERYSQQENIIYNHVQPWYTHDLCLYSDFRIKERYGLRVNLEINNLLGQDYEVIANFPMPKQNARCTVTFTY